MAGTPRSVVSIAALKLAQRRPRGQQRPDLDGRRCQTRGTITAAHFSLPSPSRKRASAHTRSPGQGVSVESDEKDILSPLSACCTPLVFSVPRMTWTKFAGSRASSSTFAVSEMNSSFSSSARTRCGERLRSRVVEQSGSKVRCLPRISVCAAMRGYAIPRLAGDECEKTSARSPGQKPNRRAALRTRLTTTAAVRRAEDGARARVRR